MRINYVLILTILLINLFGCQANSQDKSPTNKTNQTNQKNVAPAKSVPLKLKLNREEAGTTENASALSDKLRKIFKDREKIGAFRPETNEVEKSVYLAADRSAPAEEIAKLFGVLKNSGASPIFIPITVKVKNAKPDPLFLVVYAGAGEYTPPVNKVKEFDVNAVSPEKEETFDVMKGFEISFIGESPGSIPVTVSRDGSYTMDGKQISANDLKTAIENRLNSKGKDEKTIFVQAENYGNMEDIAKIADSAGAAKVYFVTKNAASNNAGSNNTAVKENDVTFSLPPAFVKDKDYEQMSGSHSVRFNGPEYSSFEMTLLDELIGKEEAESEINREYEYKKRTFTEAKVTKTEIDGAPGFLTIQNYEDGYQASWFGVRKKNGKQQPVTITYSCKIADSGYCDSEFSGIIKSIKFN